MSEASATVELDKLEALILDLLEDKLEGEFEEVEDLIDDEGWQLIEESEEAEDDFVHLIFDEDEDGKTFGEILPSFFAKSEVEDKDKEAFEEDEVEDDDIW